MRRHARPDRHGNLRQPDLIVWHPGPAERWEAASLEGYYTFLSMVMNTARTSLPAGAKPQLTQFPKNY